MVLFSRIVSIVFLILSAPSSFAATSKDLPDFTGWVNDYAGVISSQYKDKMSVLIRELEEKTSAEIAVVTMASIAPYSESEYAQMLFDKWKIGKKGKDNGVILLLAVKERKWRIQTGYGVESVLTDALCSQIGREQMAPFLKQNKYSEGLFSGVIAVARLISRDGGVSLTGLQGVKLEKPRQAVPVFFYIFIFPFFLVWNIP